MSDWTLGMAAMSLAALTAFAACFAVRWLAPRVGLVDRPGERKIHARPMPTGGGLAVWLAVVLPLAVVAGVRHGQPGAAPTGLWLGAALPLGAATAMLLIGLIDDVRPLGWRTKLAAQVLVAAVFAALHARFGSAPWSGADLATAVPLGVVCAAWIVLVTNSLNLLDNMDGLCAGVGAVAAVALGVSSQSDVVPGAAWTDSPFVIALGLLAASLLGFLCHNRPPARLFLGDAGSYFVGSLLALGALEAAGGVGRFSPAAALGALCAVAVPLYDTASVVVIRLAEGRSPFVGDRSHLSHRLAGGWGRARAVLVLVAAAAACGASGIGVATTGDARFALVVLVVLGALETLIAQGRRRFGGWPSDPPR